MKTVWKILLIILGVLVFLYILAVPLAPLWVRLGVEPKCLQGNFPKLKLVDCTGPMAVSSTPAAIPTVSASGPIPVIVDDDGSPDGMAAMLFFLQNPQFDVRAVTISYGEAHPEKFALHVAQILAAMGRKDIPVGYGKDAPLEGANAFPEPWRQASDAFWNVTLPAGDDAVQPVPAVELITEILSASDQPVMMFISGAHTNLAEALRLNPDIADNIRSVYIMGGAVNVPGNINSDWSENENKTAEWNIYVDTRAASEVFNSGINLHLVPLDATNQILWTKDDLAGWKKGDSPESALAADLLQMMFDTWSTNQVYIWDLVTAATAALPEVCPEKQLALDVNITPGPDEGQLISTDKPENISACLEPDASQIKAIVMSVFQMP